MTSPASTERDYAAPGSQKVKRVILAIILCGFAACVLVALVGFAAIFTLNFLTQAILEAPALSPGSSNGGQGFLQGLAVASLASALNWFFGYFTIPAAMVALAASIGQFPRRRIVATNAYLRWGAIWGAILVAAPSVFGSFAISSAMDPVSPATILGALSGGAGIGALAGLGCAGLFLLIVRPKSQLGHVDASVF